MPTSIPLQPTITEAGLAAVFNDQNTGVEFVLSHIAFGTAQYTPDGSETALRVEKVRVPIAGGGRISPTQIQIYAVAMAAAGNPFFVGEVGFFGDNGATLLAVYSSTGTPGLFLSDTVATSVSYGLGLAALPANSVSVTIDPSASAALLIMGNHVAAADPHPQYVEKVNGVAFYDPTLTFNLGAEIIGDDLLVYQSIQANNIGHAPSSSPTWWVPLYNYGDTPVAGLTNANITLSSTQAARAHLTFSGALTAAINIVFPNWVKDWTVVNNTTGAFSLTCKTAAGTGVVIPQNGSPTKIRGDGTNIAQLAENVAAATAGQHAVQFAQVAAIAGTARNLAALLLVQGPSATWTADELLIKTALGGLAYTFSNVSLPVSLGASGIGGIVGTAPAANGFGAIYAATGPGVPLKGFVTDATAAKAPEVYGGTLPAGYTASQLIGIAPISATATQFAPFAQMDRHVDWTGTNIVTGSVGIGGPSLSTSTGIPFNARFAGGFNQVGSSAASTISQVITPSTIPNAGGQNNTTTLGTNGSEALPWHCAIVTPQGIYRQTTNTAGTPSFTVSTNQYDF
ncbi:phage tail protein [Paraburkholderia phytofirmans]|uniref:phage tail-collar fiber domain-containing protein n=1 Tax=Paraburkholderia phytofirmans TaxID=261302 RepID=UPI0038BCDD07